MGPTIHQELTFGKRTIAWKGRDHHPFKKGTVAPDKQSLFFQNPSVHSFKGPMILILREMKVCRPSISQWK
jgi:hypothetical protein